MRMLPDAWHRPGASMMQDELSLVGSKLRMVTAVMSLARFNVRMITELLSLDSSSTKECRQMSYLWLGST